MIARSRFSLHSTILNYSVRLGADQLGTCLLALRYLFSALQRRGTAVPSDLRPDDFIEALADYRRNGGGADASHTLGHHLERLAAEADYFEISALPLEFKNPEPSHRAQSRRIDRENISRRIGEDKLPPLEALAAYAQCTNQPLNDDERILLRATDLHIVRFATKAMRSRFACATLVGRAMIGRDQGRG